MGLQSVLLACLWDIYETSFVSYLCPVNTYNSHEINLLEQYKLLNSQIFPERGYIH